jgi:hypothetical protein
MLESFVDLRAKDFRDSTLSRSLPYFAELVEYLCEKSFATDVITVCTGHWRAKFYVGNVSKEFGEQIIMPWVTAWSLRNRPFDIKLPRAAYREEENCMILIVPLASQETVTLELTTMQSIQHRTMGKKA